MSERNELSSAVESQSISEPTVELQEAAGRAAAMLAVNESAARGDWSQDRIDAAHARIDSQYSPEPVTPAGADLIGALRGAQQEVLTSEPSHAAALTALDNERRQQLYSIDEAAARGDWPQDRTEAAKAKVESRYEAK